MQHYTVDNYMRTQLWSLTGPETNQSFPKIWSKVLQAAEMVQAKTPSRLVWLRKDRVSVAVAGSSGEKEGDRGSEGQQGHVDLWRDFGFDSE